MRIAIIQNKIGISGRDVVISEFIKLCNQLRVIPIIFSFSPDRDGKRFKLEYGQDLNFKLYPITQSSFKRGTAYQTPLLNIIAAQKLKNFDIVFNSGRCFYFLPPGPKYLHYVHFPLEASLKEEEHLKSFFGHIYKFPLKMIYAGRARKIKNGIFLANSKFTSDAIQKTYPAIDRSKIKIIYPPCKLRGKIKDLKPDLDVVTLGSFISDKRQIEQLIMAKALFQFNFSLIGNIKSNHYYKNCARFIKRKRIKNVALYPNAPRDKVEALLKRSKIYLHSKRKEHFGISTVEAIDHSCIPIVHDSGGSREIVPYNRLRFKTTDEAIEKIMNVLKMGSSERTKVLSNLKDHIMRYSVEEFRASFRAVFSLIT